MRCEECGGTGTFPHHISEPSRQFHEATCSQAPEREPAPQRPMGWWVLEGVALLAMLRRVQSGEDPDLVYAEEYANCEHEERFCDSPRSSCPCVPRTHNEAPAKSPRLEGRSDHR